MLSEEGVGSTHSANIIPRNLIERGHDVTVYCPITDDRTESSIPSPQDYEIVTFPISESDLRPRRWFSSVGEGIRESLPVFNNHDVIHSYESPISALSELRKEIDVPVITTLNGYGQVCAKKDLYHNDRIPCRENGLLRCSECIFRSTLTSSPSDRFHGASVYNKYDGIARLPVTAYMLAQRFHNLNEIRSIQESCDEIDAYHVQADHLANIYTEFGFPENKFYTAPNILDDDFLVANKADGSPPFQLLYVGSLVKKKGPQILPEVVNRLNQHSDYEFEFTIAGDGYLQSELEHQADLHNGRIDVIGRVPYEDLPELYSEHDMFLYPGIWEEPFARVFLEAMASGTPIVGTPVGDLQSIVGNTGIITDGTVSGLTSGVIDMVESGDLLDRAAAAQERARAYLPESVMPEFEEMYRHVATLDSDNSD